MVINISYGIICEKDNKVFIENGESIMEELLTLQEASLGQEYYFCSIEQYEKQERHLARLGLVKGKKVVPVSKDEQNRLVIMIHGSRLAIDSRLAKNILLSKSKMESHSFALSEAKVGMKLVIDKILGTGAVKRRLMDMGLTKKTPIAVRKVAPLGDPIEINIRGYELTLRKQEAELIMVQFWEEKE